MDIYCITFDLMLWVSALLIVAGIFMYEKQVAKTVDKYKVVPVEYDASSSSLMDSLAEKTKSQIKSIDMLRALCQ